MGLICKYKTLSGRKMTLARLIFVVALKLKQTLPNEQVFVPLSLMTSKPLLTSPALFYNALLFCFGCCR